MKKWLINYLPIFILPAVILLLDGCYPNNSISLSESDVTITRFNDSADFQSLKTYYMPNEVIPIRTDTSDRTPIPEEDLILSLIQQNLDKYGWIRIAEGDTTQTPDVVVITYAWMVTSTSVGWFWPGWGVPGWGWGGWWGGWFPPTFPPVPVVTQSSTGTVLTDMFNPNDYEVIGNDTLGRIYWEGALHGVLTSSNINSRLTTGINQQYTQSPYLKLN
jgi:hypothetical protein